MVLSRMRLEREIIFECKKCGDAELYCCHPRTPDNQKIYEATMRMEYLMQLGWKNSMCPRCNEEVENNGETS